MNAPLRSVLIGVLALAVSLTACSGSGGANSPGQSDTPVSNEAVVSEAGGDGLKEAEVSVQHISLAEAREVSAVVASTRKVGLEVLASFPKETLVTSPASTVVALSMLGATADGETEDQLSLLLGATGVERDMAVNALVGSLDPYRVPVDQIDPETLPASPQVHLANQIVLHTGTKVQDTYLEGLKEWYDAGVLETDLATTEGFVPINDWVKRNTAGLIDKSAVEPSAELRLILQNAMVFSSRWHTPFSPGKTMVSEFQTGSGTTVEVPFLNALLPLRYGELDGWQAVELPYGEDGNMVALYVLPPEGTLPTSITPKGLSALEEALEEAEVGISVPKLDLKSTAELNDPLQRAGLTSVFAQSPPALTYISKSEDLAVSIVVQQGRFRLDEEGTVAAALTEIGIEATGAPAAPPHTFFADRPHMIIIKDQEVGWDLFQVLVNDPS